MLTAKAHSVSLKLKEERNVAIPPRALLLHDESGRDWPKRSCLIAPTYQLTGKPISPDQAGKGWLGRNYEAHAGSLRLPPADLSAWTRVGEIAQIHYVRRGTFAPGLFKHDFKRERFVFPDHGPTELFKGPGGFYRIDLPPSGIINWRGFVQP